MDNDLRGFQLSFLKIQKDMERLGLMINLSYSGVYEQMERALEPVRRQHLELARSIDLSGSSFPCVVEIWKANQRWQQVFDQATASTRVFEDLSRSHQTWLDITKSMQDSIARLQAAAKLSLGNVAYRLTVTERLLSGINFEAIGRAVVFPKPIFREFKNVIGGMTLAYGKLADSILTIPDVTHLPAFSLPGATREVFVTGNVLDAICTPDGPDRERDASEVELIAEVELETSVCIGLLQSVDPALARPYIGAHNALQSQNPDRSRHILVSLRELWSHLLRRIAPDEQVLSWLPKEDKQLLHEGQPTRAARVLFVCRSLNHEPLSDFIVQDTRALVKLVELLNHVHDLELKLSDEQLGALLLRTDSWITYILQVWDGT
jgi:hypothetical protein